MGLIAMLILAAVAGDAATRDVRTRLEPLMHAAPVGRAAYLGGRFLGTFMVAAMLLAAGPLARFLVPLVHLELAAEVVGPFRPEAYLQSYVLLLLPNAFVVTALLFSIATLVRHTLGRRRDARACPRPRASAHTSRLRALRSPPACL